MGVTRISIMKEWRFRLALLLFNFFGRGVNINQLVDLLVNDNRNIYWRDGLLLLLFKVFVNVRSTVYTSFHIICSLPLEEKIKRYM